MKNLPLSGPRGGRFGPPCDVFANKILGGSWIYQKTQWLFVKCIWASDQAKKNSPGVPCPEFWQHNEVWPPNFGDSQEGQIWGLMWPKVVARYFKWPQTWTGVTYWRYKDFGQILSRSVIVTSFYDVKYGKIISWRHWWRHQKWRHQFMTSQMIQMVPYEVFLKVRTKLSCCAKFCPKWLT